MQSVLSRYLDADALSRLAGRRLEPRGLVLGNLAGAHASPLAGFAVEFAGHREYSPGDDPRHIDWRVFYRRDKLFIRQYEMETNFVCHIVLDSSASMRYGDGEEQKLNYAARLAATLGYVVVHQGDKVSLAVVDDEVRAFVPPSNSMAQVLRMTEQLDQVEPKGPTQLAAGLAQLAARLGRREIVMIASDFFTDLDALAPELARLRYQWHEVVLLHVLHHDERAFDFNGMVRFVGLEGADEELTSPSQIREAYLAALAQLTGRLEEMCFAGGMELVSVDTHRPIADVLVDHLNQRGRFTHGR